MTNIAAFASPSPQTIFLRRGNNFAVTFYGRPLVDISTWTVEGVIHTVGDPEDVLATYTITYPDDYHAVLTLSIAQIEALEVGTYAHYARVRTAGDASVKTFLCGTAVVLEV